MTQSIHPQYITDEHEKRVSVLNELEELDDIRLYDEARARNEPTILLAEYRQKRLHGHNKDQQ